MAIRAALIFNNHGKPRMTRFYSQLPTSRQQALIQRAFSLVHRRTSQGTTSSGREVCNFLDAPELRPLLPPAATRATHKQTEDDGGYVFAEGAPSNKQTKSSSTSKRFGPHTASVHDDQLRVIYRHYATLYFVFIVDEGESELGILDLIQVFVEALDRSFENVCELDLIFHFDEVHAILDEIIQGGLVLETNIAEIAASSQAAIRARKASASSQSVGGGMKNAAGMGGSQAWTPPVGLGGMPWDTMANVSGWAKSQFGGAQSGHSLR